MRIFRAFCIFAFLFFGNFASSQTMNNFDKILDIKGFDNVSYKKLEFTPDLQLRRENTIAFLEKMKREGMNVDANIEAVFLNPKTFEETEKALKSLGLNLDNAADAYAFWWLDIWMAANQTDFTTSEAQAIGAKKQAANLLLRATNLAKASNSEKQKFADEMVLEAIIIEGGLIRGRTDKVFRAQLSQIALNKAKAKSLEIERFELGQSGFIDKYPVPKLAKANSPVKSDKSSISHNSPIYNKVAEVVFYLWADMQFHPIVLFKDGQTYDLGDEALSKLDINQSKISEKKDWGLWNKQTNRYTLIDGANGKSSQYTLAQSIYRAHAGKKNEKLDGEYKSVSSSLLPWYGEVTTLQTRRLRFMPDGSLSDVNEFAGTGGGNISGVIIAQGGKNAKLGNYEISGNEIKLVFQNGVEKHMFFAFGSKGSNSEIDRDMIFIGRTAYIRQNRK